MKVSPFTAVLAVGIVAVVAGGWLLSRQPAQQSQLAESQPATEQPTQALPMDIANYVDYSDPVLLTAQQKGRPILFFAATTWCQTCSALEAEILERSAELPVPVTILKVDYDNDSAMKQQFGVTTQHTLIVLNEQGEEVKRWIGGDFDTLIQEFQNI